MESLLKEMGPDSLKWMLISQSILMGVFILQKLVDYIFMAFRNSKVKEQQKAKQVDREISLINERINLANTQLASLNSKVDICVTQLFKIPKMEQDLCALIIKAERAAP